MKKVTTRLENINGPKPTVYVELSGSTSSGPAEYGNTYGKGYLWGGIIEKCSGTNIAEGAVEDGKGAPISPEDLLKQNPDIIIMASGTKVGYGTQLNDAKEWLKAFTERPGWDDLNAVKNGRVYAIDHGLSRSLHSFVAMQAMAKCLYPEEFEDLDPAENYKEFHEKFLPVEYSGLWTITL